MDRRNRTHKNNQRWICRLSYACAKVISLRPYVWEWNKWSSAQKADFRFQVWLMEEIDRRIIENNNTKSETQIVKIFAEELIKKHFWHTKKPIKYIGISKSTLLVKYRKWKNSDEHTRRLNCSRYVDIIKNKTSAMSKYNLTKEKLRWFFKTESNTPKIWMNFTDYSYKSYRKLINPKTYGYNSEYIAEHLASCITNKIKSLKSEKKELLKRISKIELFLEKLTKER